MIIYISHLSQQRNIAELCASGECAWFLTTPMDFLSFSRVGTDWRDCIRHAPRSRGVYSCWDIIRKWLDALRGSLPARQINCTTPCNLCITTQNIKIPCNTITNNQMPCNTMQCNTMHFNWRQYNTMQYNEIPCNTLFRSFETSTRPKRVYFGCVWWPWVEPWRANWG